MKKFILTVLTSLGFFGCATNLEIQTRTISSDKDSRIYMAEVCGENFEVVELGLVSKDTKTMRFKCKE